MLGIFMQPSSSQGELTQQHNQLSVWLVEATESKLKEINQERQTCALNLPCICGRTCQEGIITQVIVLQLEEAKHDEMQTWATNSVKRSALMTGYNIQQQTIYKMELLGQCTKIILHALCSYIERKRLHWALRTQNLF